MSTCRCSMCGRKNAGNNKNRRLYRTYNVTQDEHGRNWDFGTDKPRVRKLLRSRMNNDLRNLIREYV